ncbi:MAG TPA: SRPBCC domain-containing protein [Caulobacteraceae bacterium]|jgi:uncharacterized protein YndB with AHSA1/START domain|nr:SRPBCC domain-containing protein [Caulobacteraceae bacterium]
MSTTTSRDAVSIVRVLNAPREAVWRACSELDALKVWWGLPDDAVMAHCTLDFRVGGTLHIGVKQASNPAMWFTSTYLEIVENERVVMEQHLSDESGAHHDSADWPPTTISLRLEDEGGKTRLSVVQSGLAGGLAGADDFAQGWSESLDRLEACVAQR